MKLDTWIERTGPKVIAKELGVDPSAVSQWRRGRSLPKIKNLIALHRMSKGVVSYQEIILHFAKRN